MKSFNELEKRFQRTAVRGASTNTRSAAGMLLLARDKTEVVLSSSRPLSHHRDDNGWFDLRLRAGNGETILLRNALTVRTTKTTYGVSRTAFEETIFPNIVIFNGKQLGEGAFVNSITFSFAALRCFFYYQYFEWISLHRATKTDLDTIKKLRRRGPRGSSDFFRPTELYVLHRPQRLFTFAANDQTYSAFAGLSALGPSWNNIQVQAQVYATIKFAKSTTIDEAIDRVWQWKRFFEQIALQPFSVDALSVRLKSTSSGIAADVYLPNVGPEDAEIHPGDLPLNRWKDRSQLVNAMRAWLLKDDARRLFRATAARVIDRSRKRISIDDVVSLCAGIESLAELGENPSISPAQIDALAAAAQAAAATHSIEVDSNRIKGVLGLLQHQSLPRRLKLLAKKLQPSVSKRDGELIADAVRDLRKVAAHGQALPKTVHPKIGPAVEALLGLCVLYDLTTCSVPISANESSYIAAMKRVRGAVDELRRLKQA